MRAPLTLPAPGPDLRVESGPLQFSGSWPGVYIRGIQALSYANALTTLLQGDGSGTAALRVCDLGAALIEAHTVPKIRRQMLQNLYSARAVFMRDLLERGKL